jgi:hypothetical protein
MWMGGLSCDFPWMWLPLYEFICNSNVVCKLVYQCVMDVVKFTCSLAAFFLCLGVSG